MIFSLQGGPKTCPHLTCPIDLRLEAQNAVFLLRSKTWMRLVRQAYWKTCGHGIRFVFIIVIILDQYTISCLGSLFGS
jgi:hypothetical protein